jgi:hypothetical protein
MAPRSKVIYWNKSEKQFTSKGEAYINDFFHENSKPSYDDYTKMVNVTGATRVALKVNC